MRTLIGTIVFTVLATLAIPAPAQTGEQIPTRKRQNVQVADGGTFDDTGEAFAMSQLNDGGLGLPVDDEVGRAFEQLVHF